MKRRADECIAHLGADIGIASLALDNEGRCTLKFDDVCVDIEYDGEAKVFFVYAVLGQVREEQAAEMMQRLLEANLFWRGTGGATLALAGATREVVLLRSMPTSHLSPAEFRSTIEDFVAAAEHWMTILASPAPAPAESPAPAPSTGWMKI